MTTPINTQPPATDALVVATQRALTPAGHHKRVKVPGAVSQADADSLARKGAAKNTQRAYTSDLKIFVDWCQAEGLQALPASQQTLARFNLARARTGCMVSTILRGMMAVRQAHRAAGYDPPSGLYLEQHWRGLKKEYWREEDKATPLSVANVKAMADAMGTTGWRALRNRALLLVGFAGGLRRSEVVSLKWEDVHWDKDGEHPGITLSIRRSKTDQTGEQRREVGLPYQASAYCPAKALEMWLLVSRIKEGYIFLGLRGKRTLTTRYLSPGTVCRLVHRYMHEAKQAKPGGKYSGHSLRAGMITSARDAGAGEDIVMKQSGHKNLSTFRGYNRKEALDRSVVPFLGL